MCQEGFLFDPNCINATRLRRLYEYWNTKRGNREFPRRSDIDPVEFSWAWSGLSLIEALDDGDFFWRIDATEVSRLFQHDMTGRRLSEYPSAIVREIIRASYIKVIESREPLRIVRNFVADNRHRSYELLLLPLSRNRDAVELIFSIPEFSS